MCHSFTIFFYCVLLCLISFYLDLPSIYTHSVYFTLYYHSTTFHTLFYLTYLNQPPSTHISHTLQVACCILQLSPPSAHQWMMLIERGDDANSIRHMHYILNII